MTAHPTCPTSQEEEDIIPEDFIRGLFMMSTEYLKKVPIDSPEFEFFMQVMYNYDDYVKEVEFL